MDNSQSAHKQELWHMKDAAKKVGVGLPSLYTRLREQGLFTKVEGKNVPVYQLQKDGLFKVLESRFWIEAHQIWKPTIKVMATYKGLILLQATADELAREKEESSGKRSRVPGGSNGDQQQGSVRGNDTQPRTAGHAGQ